MKQNKDTSPLLIFTVILVLSIVCPHLAAAIFVLWVAKWLLIDHSTSTPKGGSSL